MGSNVSDDVLNLLRENPDDLIILASWFYKNGENLISDFEYNMLTSKYKDLHFVWDELEEPKELLDKYGIDTDFNTGSLVSNDEERVLYLSLLADAGTKSIKPFYDERDIYNHFYNLRNCVSEIVVSLKVDGVSTRNIFEYNEADGLWYFKASLSRSRESTGFDYTDGMQYVLNKGYKFNSNCGEVSESGKRIIYSFGEAYVERSALDYLRKKYKKQDTWKTPRSTALSMLRAVVNKDDYQYLKYKCFNMSVGSTQEEMLKDTLNAGIDIVPYEVIRFEDIPKDFNGWSIWFNNLIDKYNNIQNEYDIEADGIVFSVNNQVEFNSFGQSTDGKYNNGNFSCKVKHWGSHIYESEVVDIHFDNEGNTSEYSVVAEVKPVVVSTGNTVRRVNCFNPGVLIKNNINIGSVIKFEYKSASSIVLVYDKK